MVTDPESTIEKRNRREKRKEEKGKKDQCWFISSHLCFCIVFLIIVFVFILYLFGGETYPSTLCDDLRFETASVKMEEQQREQRQLSESPTIRRGGGGVKFVQQDGGIP